ncbi:MAG: type IX secretion system membrane protein PorP/SprF [Bacteroidetes bacterium]|nr:type IX secretion system membrane protein PorP/SprF [Bacteroidota bacterium]
MKKYIVILLIFNLQSSIFNLQLKAQQDLQVSHYMFNSMYLNPGYAGIEGVPGLTFIWREQWAFYDASFDDGGSPSTQAFTFNTPVPKIGGVGIQVVNDRLGPMSNFEIQLSYSYNLELTTGKLGFGVRTGMFSRTIGRFNYRPNDEPDPVIPDHKETQIKPDMAFGTWFKDKSDRYYGGVAINHLLQPKFDFGKPDTVDSKLKPHLNVTGGYNYQLNYELTITPSFIFKTDFNTISYEINVMGMYNDQYWGGLAYRQQDAFTILAGISFLKDNALRTGYSFDLTIIGAKAKKPTSHEIMLAYTLPPVQAAAKPIIRTPRFRH